MQLSVRHLTGPDALTEIGAPFDALAAAESLPVTARRTWLQAWVDTHSAWEPWVVLAEADGELLAAAPLARRRAGLLQVVLLGHGPTDDARLPARTPEAAVAVAQAVAAELRRGGPWRMRFQQLPADDLVTAALVEALPAADVRPGQGMPLVETVGSDPDAYLSKNSKKALAKIRNRLRDRDLEPLLRWVTDADEVIALIPELMRVHRERDLALGRRPDHDDPASAAFYREVISRHARSGEIDLLTLRLDGDLAAYVCAFRDGRTLRSWDNRLAPRWADLSAGRLANTEALRHVVASEHYDALDWMRGEESYKLQTATRVVPTADLQAWSSPSLRRVEALASTTVERARTAVRGSAVHRGVQRVRRLRHGAG